MRGATTVASRQQRWHGSDLKNAQSQQNLLTFDRPGIWPYPNTKRTKPRQHGHLQKRQTRERIQRRETQKVNDGQHCHQDQNTPSTPTSGGSCSRDACSCHRELQE